MANLLDRLLRDEPGLKSMGTLHSADHLVDEVTSRSPNVVLLDLSMPGRDPLAALQELSERCPDTRVIVFSGHSDPNLVEETAKRGAWGFVVKDAGIDPILDAIRQVGAGRKLGRVTQAVSSGDVSRPT
jgi:DNA-binding NarL/FixJ family response regulator